MAAAKIVKEIVAEVIVPMARLAKDVVVVAIEERVEEAVPKERKAVGHIVRPMLIGSRSMRR